MADDQGQRLAPLEAHECWQLLRSADVGRLAVSVDGQPDIFPVNFVIDHGTIVFRTAEGTKLAASLASRHVAFEVDQYDAAAGDAWSVVLKGTVEEIKRIPDVLDAMTFPLFPWHAGSKNRYVRVVPAEVSGRRFHVVDPSGWRTSMTDVHRASPE